MAVDNSRASVASGAAPPLFSCLSWLIVFSLFAFAGCSSAPKRPPTGTPDPDTFPVRARHRRAERQGLVHGPRVFPAAGRQLSAEPLPRRRQARHRRYAPRRGHRRRLRAGDQRVQGVPVAVPDPQACGLRAVQAGDGALLPDARPDAGSDRNRRSDQGADGVRRAVSQRRAEPALSRRPGQAAAGQGPPRRPRAGRRRAVSRSRGGIRARSSG